jgi:hypothetical protein
VFKPHGIVLEEARIIADELGLPPWWLNEQASAYVAPGGDPSAPRIFDHAANHVEHIYAKIGVSNRAKAACSRCSTA